MNVYIVGAGAVGNYFGQVFRDAATTITFAPRDLTAVTAAQADLAIVATKSFATDGAIATLRRAIGGGASPAILCPQNGIGSEEKLAAEFGADNVIACALTVPLERTADGGVAGVNRGGVGLAPVGAVAHNWLIAAFQQRGVIVTVAGDYQALKWSKLALNIVANASCAILDLLPRELVRDRDAFGLDLEAIREVRAVMRARGIATVDLPGYSVRALFAAAALPGPLARTILGRRIAGARGSKPPSLLLDVRAGCAQTEVDALNGAVATAAQSAGARAPANAAFARVLTDIVSRPQLRASYRGRPAALVAEVDRERLSKT